MQVHEAFTASGRNGASTAGVGQSLAISIWRSRSIASAISKQPTRYSTKCHQPSTLTRSTLSRQTSEDPCRVQRCRLQGQGVPRDGPRQHRVPCSSGRQAARCFGRGRRTCRPRAQIDKVECMEVLRSFAGEQAQERFQKPLRNEKSHQRSRMAL